VAPHLSAVRTTVVLGLALAGAVWPNGASAQLGRRTTERLLIMNPLLGPGVDSTMSAKVGDALRDRVANRFRLQFSVIPGTTICEALEASGFDCNTPQPHESAAALARFLTATGFIVGWLNRTGDSLRLTLRMVDAAGSGLSGWQSFTVPATTTGEDLGRLAGDGLDDRMKAAQYARECSERRGRGDAKGAVERASKAFAMFPDYPSAWQCVAYAYEVEKQPVDSLVSALRHAAKGDSLNGTIWRDLGRRMREAGDTAGSWEAFRNQLRAEPTDGALRLGVAQGLMSQKKYQEAVDVLDEGLAMNPGDMPTLQLKERICLEGSLWKCGLSALGQEYDLDTGLVADTAFIQKAFGTAQSVPDTAAMLKWSKVGVERFPDQLWAWRARAAALKLGPDARDEIIAAYEQIVKLDSTQIPSALAIAQYMFDSTLVIYTGVPLDTARLVEGERMISLVAGQARSDTATMMALAGMLYGPAAKIAQKRMVPYLPLATRFLENALQYDLRGRLATTLNFFLGLAYSFEVFDQLEALDKSKSCETLQQKIDLTDRALAALTIGKSVSPPTANQFLPYLTNLKRDLPKYKPAWKCQ
jgi:tetratricopeptide (TPR) repeat protein